MRELEGHMEIIDKKGAISLGIRIGSIFLMALVTVFLVVYYVLSQNFQKMMTDYTIKLVETMTDQGVKMVETELDIGRQEVSFLANSFQVPESGRERVEFPQSYTKDGYLRMIYVTRDGSAASDGRKRDIGQRQDIRSAFAGETAVYGPYFNEENEFVVCYSAPVRQGDNIIGVLCVEKNGYQFCELIENIRFADSGECYIINDNGTDIAVSDPDQMELVDTQYNARELFEDEADEETKSIIALEQKGLNGESGIGTCYWKGGLYYLAYRPIPSVNWVILAGLREEEIAAMTQSSIFASVSKGPVLPICLFLVLLLTILIIYWIISSMKKNNEISEKLNVMANYDALTGLMNRNSYHAAIDALSNEEHSSFACVYLDVNGLHELNNHLGHQAGDQMLKAVADALQHAFSKDKIYRIGGDEFLVLCRGSVENDIYCAAKEVREELHKQSYEVSIGIAWQEHKCNAMCVINNAEAAMRQDKRRFYQNSGNERRMRVLNTQLEQMIVEKQDADAFLAVLAPEFKGVYFVNLGKDTIRHLYIPPYFAECLQEADNKFSRALLLYAKKIVKPEYYKYFQELCDYEELEKRLNINDMPEFIYQKENGEWLKLRVLKFSDYTSRQRETLWIFTDTDNPKVSQT